MRAGVEQKGQHGGRSGSGLVNKQQLQQRSREFVGGWVAGEGDGRMLSVAWVGLQAAAWVGESKGNNEPGRERIEELGLSWGER